MLNSLFTVATQVWILFALIGVGALLRKARLITDEGNASLSNILLLVVTPCLIVDSFQRPFDTALLRELGFAFLFAAALHFILIVLAKILFRQRNDATPVLRLATIFSNAGFMGLPLEQALFGARGVVFGVVYVVVFNLFIWSWGFHEARFAFRGSSRSGLITPSTLFNPGTIGLAVGLGLFLLRIRLPSVLGEPVRLLSLLNTPLAMLVIGYQLGGAHLGEVLRRPSAYGVSALRLVAAPLLLIALFLPFRHGLDRTMMLSLVTGASAPVAAMVAIFAAHYRRDTDLAVAFVSGTALLSILTMPPVVALAMQLL